jgi:myxalamid-type polyketide synthase MxaE and MxaD
VSPTAVQIEDWLVARVANLTGLGPEEIDVQEPLLRYGLDSVAVVTLATDLEAWLGYRFRSNPLADHPTIAALASFLAGQVAGGDRPA